MNTLAFQSGDFVILLIGLIILGCVLGGMVKFYKAINVLRKGPPEVDQEVLAEQEQEFKNNEQDH